jgi:hypothetical protein
MINFVSVCTDKYPLLYAEKLHQHFNDVSNLAAEHYCITDRPSEIEGWATPIAPFKKAAGWWNKVNLFSSEMPCGPILYMDLDIVILQNFDAEIEAMLNQLPVLSCVSDAVNWMGCKFSSSMMVFESGQHADIFEEFLRQDDSLNIRPGGDQVWIGPQLEQINYIDKTFPNLKKNLKFHLMDHSYTPPPLLHTEISDKVKLVDCGGDPKPHILEAVPYIKENWHDVRPAS